MGINVKPILVIYQRKYVIQYHILGSFKNSQITLNQYKGKFTFVLEIYEENPFFPVGVFLIPLIEISNKGNIFIAFILA